MPCSSGGTVMNRYVHTHGDGHLTSVCSRGLSFGGFHSTMMTSASRPGAAALGIEAVHERLEPFQRIAAMIVVPGSDDDAEVRVVPADHRAFAGRHRNAAKA